MKLNKSKGKVHPSPSSFSSSSSSSSSSSFSSVSLSPNLPSDPISALNALLPAAILTLISALSLQDREVLAYLIAHSLKSSPLNSSPAPILDKSKKSKKSGSTRHLHKSPSFDCDCFDCYTAYWFRWDSSPHRELIHQAIEAFEEHLAKTEQPKKSGRSRRREKEKEKEKAARRCVSPVVETSLLEESLEILPEMGSPSENRESLADGVAEREKHEAEERERGEEMKGSHGKQQHKGLARKMLPDVMELFNSRLWNLWGSNV